MGNFLSRRNAIVEDNGDQGILILYKYPPRSGNFFGSHFIMGGERFDTPQPESYLFGENADLNFLGNKPTAFPYPPPQANEPTKTVKSLINIRKESVRFTRAINDKMMDSYDEDADRNILCGVDNLDVSSHCAYNIEFAFDSDAKCAITIYYFCTEEITPNGINLIPRDDLSSETYHYDKGLNQYFSQPKHVFKPQLISEEDLVYKMSKEQYPIAIHCVAEEGPDDGRQSHTTICVVDHHADSGIYILRALKQKIFVDGLSYLLQEIYGIENKAINKSSVDDEADDHGSECVICMSETRDTLILPCRHLCLCNSCADSLRYQANNCPICRAPFRALLQIRAVQKGINHTLHQQSATTSSCGEILPYDIPVGYVSVSLIEALNGPPQYINGARGNNNEILDDPINGVQSLRKTSPHKTSSQRRQKVKKNASTWTSSHEIDCTINSNISEAVKNVNMLDVEAVNGKKPSLSGSSVISIDSEHAQKNVESASICNGPTAVTYKRDSLHEGATSVSSNCNISGIAVEDEDDSDNEKLSPLLSNSVKSGKVSERLELQQHSKAIGSVPSCNLTQNTKITGSFCGTEHGQLCVLAKNKTIPDLSTGQHLEIPTKPEVRASDPTVTISLNADDSDYYTPEDTQTSILSPLCPEYNKIGDQANAELSSACISRIPSIILKKNEYQKKNFQRKSTSVGNIISQQIWAVDKATPVINNDVKVHISSLPDMSNSPTTGNVNSTRSSSDSYSSSSSTRQLLGFNTAVNIIIDDKTSMQNAVNV